jgi:hypothetical protein
LKRLSYLSVGATGLKAAVNGSVALVVIANALVIDFAKQIFSAIINSFSASHQGSTNTGLQAGGQRAKDRSRFNGFRYGAVAGAEKRGASSAPP